MTITLVFLVFSIVAVLHKRYRGRVPSPYDIHVEEYTHTSTIRPGAMQYVGKNRERIFPHEFLFLWLDLHTLNQSGCDCHEAFFWQENGNVTEIAQTPDFMRRVEKYQNEYPRALIAHEGEAEVDSELESLIPFTFRQLSFSPKGST